MKCGLLAFVENYFNNVNHGLWVQMHHFRFLGCKHAILQCEMLMTDSVGVGWGYGWEISVLSTQFCFETQTALKKIKSIKKKKITPRSVSVGTKVSFSFKPGLKSR